MELASKILSDITIFLKYSKFIPELNRRETYEELVTRNKNMHLKKFPFISGDIEKAYKFVYDRKILPSMRSMQFAGKPIEVNPSRIYNCSYLPINDLQAFPEVMFLLLGGTGVGYSVQKHHVDTLPEVRKPRGRNRRYLIGDSIEGWADAIKILMFSYFEGTSKINFDFNDIRPKGARLITSGGKAPGPDPLKICLTQIESILSNKNDGDKLKPIEVHDIICHIADAVLAGGIRRAACLSLFSADDEEMLSSKFGKWYELNPQRARANNSISLLRHRIKKDFFLSLWEKIEASQSGEPGICFSNDKEWGVNPCAEISLRPFSFCNLVEINTSDIESQSDLDSRAKAAALIGTLQASYTDFHYLRPIWQKTTERDALLGIGLTGIASGKLEDLDLSKAAAVSIEENLRISALVGINQAARITCVKPSGTTSIVFGCSSGIHAWHDEYYIRRVRIGKNESIYTYLLINHPDLLEDDYFRPHDSAVIAIPQKAPAAANLRNNENAIDLLERVKWISNSWIKSGHISGCNSHNVSATISVKKDEWNKIGEWMWENKQYYNGLSVLPYDDMLHTHKQLPFESCSKETYEKMIKSLEEVDLTKIIEYSDNTELKEEAACGGGACQVTSF